MRTFPAIVVTMLLLLVSCSPLKFVPADHSLLQRVGISSDTIVGDINISQLNGYVRQQANQRWFSALKIPLAIYSLAGRDVSRSTSSVRHRVRTIPSVEPPRHIFHVPRRQP